LRQLDRLQEPDEMAILRRLSGVALRIRATFGPNGLIEREVGVSRGDAVRSNMAADDLEDGINWVSLVDAEDLLLAKQTRETLSRREGRRAARLPANRAGVVVSELTTEEIRLLDMSQKFWESFRARRGPAAAPA